MTLPSFDAGWRDTERTERTKPRVYVLEVRDRDKPGGDSIAWLLVERQETYQRDEQDGTAYKASVSLFYERIAPKNSYRMEGRGCFVGGYSRGDTNGSLVSLTSLSTPKGTVCLSLSGLEGQRIGTFLMNEIVTWVKQWPDATVCPIDLLGGQADADNKARRNRFYEQFGLVFDYRDPEHREGLSRPMQASALTTVETWKANIQERDVRDFIAEALYDRERATRELSSRDRAFKSLVDEIKQAKAKPIMWALRQTWWRLAPILEQAAALLLVCLLVWLATG